MRLAVAVLLLAAIAPHLAQAQTTYIAPGYSMPYRSNGYASPYPPVLQGVPGVTPYSGSVATGAYPPVSTIAR